MTRDHPTILDAFLQRRLVQWGFGYVAGAWILLEFTDFLADMFGWPEVVVRLVLTVFAFGFLAVLVVAWYHGEKGSQAVTRREVALLCLIGIAGLGTAGAVALGGPRGSSPTLAQTAVARMPPDDPRDAPAAIAVLPFVNLSGNPEDDAFADGVTEDIIAQLARIPHLRVISRTSIMQYRDTALSLVDIGRELNVDLILEGSARRVGDRVRIVAQLIDARTDEHLWSETYDREMTDILRIQSDVAGQIGAALSETLAPMGEVRLAADPGAVDHDAYRLLMRGRRLARSADAAEQAEGLELLAQAVEREPALLRALSAMPEALGPGTDGPLGLSSPEGERLRTVVQRAVDAASMPGDVQAALRWRLVLSEGDLEAAREAAEEAVRANPNDAAARRWYGLLLAQAGSGAEAIEQLRIARSVDPHSPTLGVDVGEVLAGMGRYGEAVGELEAVLARAPDHLPAQVALGVARHGAGDVDRARAELERAVEASGGHPAALAALGYVLARTGDEVGARAVLDSLLAAEGTRHVPAAFIARIHEALGDSAEARRWSERQDAQGVMVLRVPGAAGGRERPPTPPDA